MNNFTSTAAQDVANFLSDVIISFFSQTPVGKFSLFLILIIIGFKLWNWGLRSRQKDIQTVILKNQAEHYMQKQEMLKEIQTLNEQLCEIKQYTNYNNEKHINNNIY